MKLSVVIPTYNRRALLERVLEGLCHQTAPEAIDEIIVVSDGSTDLTADTAAGFRSRLPIRFVHQGKRGVSSARNLGLIYVNSPITLFLDDDVVPSASLIGQHASFHQESPGLECVLLGYVTWHPEIRVTPFMRWYGEYGGLFGYSHLKSGTEVDRRFLYTCNVSLKTDFLRKSGGFNESLTVLEDHELGYRLAKLGMRMTFLKPALGYHYQAFSFEDACRRSSRYSSGLPAFLQTEAGKSVLRSRKHPLFRVADYTVRALGPALRIARSIVDTDLQLPGPVYRLFYWYFATNRSFWDPARRALAERQPTADSSDLVSRQSPD
jgi:glycosyltransferase involved in cell wall biosynthesis